MIGYGGRSELSHFKSKTFEGPGAHIFIRCLRRWSRGLRDLPLPAPSHSRPRLAGPSAIAGLKTLSLRPWHGPFHLPFNHRSPWLALVGVAARAPWRRRPLHRSGMGGAVGPVKIRTRRYSLSKGSGYRATTRPAQPSGLLVCPNFSEITPVRFSAFRLPGISRQVVRPRRRNKLVA